MTIDSEVRDILYATGYFDASTAERYEEVVSVTQATKDLIAQEANKARLEIAINAMAIALYWIEEDGRPKHLWQDLWDVMDVSVLDHIDKKYIEEAKGHFKAQLTAEKGKA